MNRKSQFGFSLLELIVSLTVAGLVLGIGVPSFIEFQRNNAMIAVANDFVSALHIARSEALKRQVPVTLCASENPLADAPECGGFEDGGYIVFVDENNGVLGEPTDGNAELDANETIVIQRPAPGGPISLFSNGGEYISFATNGYLNRSAGTRERPSTTVILICDDRGNRDAGGRSSARVVNVAPTGRAQVQRGRDDVVAAVDATDGTCP